MLTVIEAATRAQMRAFFKAGKNAGYLKEEEKYLKLYALTPLNPLFSNGPRAFLCAYRDGKPVFRALTGVDFRYVNLTGNRTGYFSLFDGENDREAAEMILEEIMIRQRKWKTDKVTGPLSPDGSGFFMGAGEGGFERPRGLFTGPDGRFSAGVLRDNGFTACDTENAYLVSVPKENPLSELCRKAEERYGAEVAKLKPRIFDERWKEKIASVSEDQKKQELIKFLDRIRRHIDKNFSFFAKGEGGACGYLISFKSGNGILRGTTLMTREGAYSAPCALSLIGAFLNECSKRGVKEAEVSVINQKNLRSERLVLRYGGVKIREYTQFTKIVTQIN